MPTKVLAALSVLAFAGCGLLATSNSGIAGSEDVLIVAQGNTSPTVRSNQQSEPCDCSNCSAYHCPPPNGTNDGHAVYSQNAVGYVNRPKDPTLTSDPQGRSTSK